eukprot:jgi/Bigna1/141370/aug1.62_g16078
MCPTKYSRFFSPKILLVPSEYRKDLLSNFNVFTNLVLFEKPPKLKHTKYVSESISFEKWHIPEPAANLTTNEINSFGKDESDD